MNRVQFLLESLADLDARWACCSGISGCIAMCRSHAAGAAQLQKKRTCHALLARPPTPLLHLHAASPCRSFRARGSRLLVLRGKPQEVLPRLFKVGWGAQGAGLVG